ncbi:MAG: hypothetical protein FWF90_09245 [Promicromonosporaceae bacterium]|nr:hypothetical protein [Promicromonosporaceae bacterium]
MLGVIGLIAHGLSSYGYEKILKASIDAEAHKAWAQGKSRADVVREIERRIDKMAVSKAMKLKLKDGLRAGTV